MDATIAALSLDLVKARLGISSDVRNDYLKTIIRGVVKEMSSLHKITLDSQNDMHLMFVVDLATWRYQNRDVPTGMPRHLQFRLHNLVISAGGAQNGDL